MSLQFHRIILLDPSLALHMEVMNKKFTLLGLIKYQELLINFTYSSMTILLNCGQYRLLPQHMRMWSFITLQHIFIQSVEFTTVEKSIYRYSVWMGKLFLQIKQIW
jgi:hypothetical protein